MDEDRRLQSLRDLEVLDSEPEEAFDSLVRIAALICDMPVSLITLIDSDRSWFLAQTGRPGERRESPRETTFCAHTILGDDILEVADTRADARFVDNPAVTDTPGIRFYAGAPLVLSNGAHIGTLCLVDQQPRQLSEAQREGLRHLANIAVQALEGRRALLIERRALAAAQAAEQAMIVSEARFRALSDGSPFGVFATDADMRGVYINSRFEEIFDITLAEVTDGRWTSRLHPDDAEAVHARWQHSVDTGTPFDTEHRVCRPDGQEIVVHVRARPVIGPDQSVTGFIGSVEDVTGRHAAERALRESEAKYRAVVEDQDELISLARPEGTLVYTNNAYARYFGFTPETIIGTSFYDHIPESERQIVSDLVHDVCAKGDIRRSENRSFAADGSLRWIMWTNRAMLAADGSTILHSVGRDFTQSRADQEALHKSESLLRQTGKLAGVGGWSLDLRNHEMVWSEQTARIHGVEPGHRPTLESALHFFLPDARLAVRTAIAKARADGIGWDLELPMIRADGVAIWVRTVGDVESEDGVPVRLIGALQDITERKEQQRALQTANDRVALATDSAGIGIWDLDLTTNALLWDPWMFRLYGLDEGSGVNLYEHWVNTLHPEDRAEMEQAHADAVNGVQPLNHNFRIVWPDGSIRYLRATAKVTRNAEGQALRLVGVNWDVTRLHHLTSDLAEQHERLRVTLQSIGDSVITTDANGMVTWLNPVAERMTGWTAAEAEGQPLERVFQIIHGETRAPGENPITLCLQQGAVTGVSDHTVLISRHGEEFGIEDSAAPIRNAEGEVLGVVLVFHDVTEQRRLSGEMNYRATHDALTGLTNRTEFETRLRRTLHTAHEDGSNHALMVIDLDHFKIVNDTCGHAVGDQLLQQISRLLSESIRSRDTLARLGGDEFGILLDHCTTDQAERIAQQICARMDDFRFVHDDRRFRIGTSIGLAPLDHRWSTTAAAMQVADAACYAAKDAGRNRVHRWVDSDDALKTRQGEMRWTTRIEQALDDDSFVLFAQKVEPLGAPLSGLYAEVLLRLPDQDGNLILPGAFLPAAERFTLASRIDRWVLTRAIKWLQSLPDVTAVDTLCINLSGQSVGDRAFHRFLIDTLTAAGCSVCPRLCLEITETVAITNLSDAARFIEQVRALGVRVALDDFGAGASSFGYLTNLSIDLLKIDGQFISSLIDNPLNDAAVRCFVDVAGIVGVKTVAEFVDRPEVLARVREIGVTYAQGFLLHRPEPLEGLLAGLVSQDKPSEAGETAPFATV